MTHADNDSRTTLWTPVNKAIVALLVLTLGVFVVYAFFAAAGSEERQTEIDQLEQQVQVLVDNDETLRTQLEDAGEVPIAPPPEDVIEDLPDADSPTPDIVVRAPSPVEIRAAVSAVISSNPSFIQPQIIAAVTQHLVENPPADGEDGEDGGDGPAGRAPTPEEIGIAVAAFCADDACKGDQGDTGAHGPGPTQEQIDAAIFAYCDARGECRGEPGRDGRSIIDTDCVDTEDGSTEWLFTYDQEPLEVRIEGPCRVKVPGPDPTDPTDPPTLSP